MIRTIYKMSCKSCGYRYYVDLFTDPKGDWEWCNICGHGAWFKEFNDGELKKYDDRIRFGEDGS
jgi:hypothetical protein